MPEEFVWENLNINENSSYRVLSASCCIFVPPNKLVAMAADETMRELSKDTRNPVDELGPTFHKHPLAMVAFGLFAFGLTYGRQRNWNSVR